MIIYTVMGTNNRIEWIAKSFTCEQTAYQFLHDCLRIVRTSNSLTDLLMFSPDPTIHIDYIKRNLSSNHINYTLHVNELVTDTFMELTLQPHNPKPFKDFI